MLAKDIDGLLASNILFAASMLFCDFVTISKQCTNCLAKINTIYQSTKLFTQ